jgi:hypothetical protein
MIATELKQGDIIEIVRHDECCRMNLRRVRIRSIRRVGDKYQIVGENLQGKNAWDYTLDLEPWETIITEPNNVGWFPFIEDEEFDG